MLFPVIILPLDPAMSREPMEGNVGGQSEAERGGGKCGIYLFRGALDIANLQSQQVIALQSRERGCSIVGIADES